MEGIRSRKRQIEDAAARGLIRSGDRTRAAARQPGMQLALRVIGTLVGCWILIEGLTRSHPDWLLAAVGVWAVISNVVLARGRLRALRAGRNIDPGGRG